MSLELIAADAGGRRTPRRRRHVDRRCAHAKSKRLSRRALIVRRFLRNKTAVVGRRDVRCSSCSSRSSGRRSSPSGTTPSSTARRSSRGRAWSHWFGTDPVRPRRAGDVPRRSPQVDADQRSSSASARPRSPRSSGRSPPTSAAGASASRCGASTCCSCCRRFLIIALFMRNVDSAHDAVWLDLLARRSWAGCCRPESCAA